MRVFAFLQLKLCFFWPLYLFKRTSQKPCLWYLCVLMAHLAHFNSPLNCFYYLCWKAGSSKEVKTGLFPNQKPQGFSICNSVPVPVTRQCLWSSLLSVFGRKMQFLTCIKLGNHMKPRQKSLLYVTNKSILGTSVWEEWRMPREGLALVWQTPNITGS